MKRIVQHPILGTKGKSTEVNIYVDGRSIKAYEGEPVAAALMVAGIRVFRKTVKGNPRALYCGIGQCTDCSMTINGIPNVRTCITPVKEGMVVETQNGVGKGSIDICKEKDVS